VGLHLSHYPLAGTPGHDQAIDENHAHHWHDASGLRSADRRGRLVRTLHDGMAHLPAGPHEFLWDGRDDTGQNVSSGVYFVRMAAGGGAEPE